VDSTSERADEGRPPGYRWAEAAALAIVAAVVLAIVLARGPFTTAQVSPAQLAAARAPRRIAVVAAPDAWPGLGPGELAPVARHLERAVEVDLELARSESALHAVEALIDGRASLAVLPALACVQAAELDREVRLLAAPALDGAVSTRTALVARRADEDAGLQGRTLCAASPSSAAALLARLWLRGRGLDPARAIGGVRSSGGDLEALADLDERRCDVAAVGEIALRAAPTERAGRLRVMAWTGAIPQGCWAGARGLGAALAQSIATALANFDPGTARPAPRLTGYSEADASTFRAVRIAAQMEGQLRPQLPHGGESLRPGADM
jgi:ABC-type phosphate/phosphonate transport system substrate-binding protein